MNIHKQKAAKVKRYMSRSRTIGLSLLAIALLGAMQAGWMGIHDVACEFLLWGMVLFKLFGAIRNGYVDEYNELMDLSDEWEIREGAKEQMTKMWGNLKEYIDKKEGGK